MRTAVERLLLVASGAAYRSCFYNSVSAFVLPTQYHHRHHHQHHDWFSLAASEEKASITSSPPTYDNDDERLHFEVTGSGRGGSNWIERSFPILDDGSEPTTINDWNIGIDGESFGTGPLSKRMYDAICSKSSFAQQSNTNNNNIDPQLERLFRMYALDFTAKEAVKAALEQNGLQLAVGSDDDDDSPEQQQQQQDEGEWCSIDSIRISGGSPGTVYDSWEDLLDDADAWVPGTPVSFVARQVPAKLLDLQLDQILSALDPDGTFREEAKESGLFLPDEDVESLDQLVKMNARRVALATKDIAEKAFVPEDQHVFAASDILSADGVGDMIVRKVMYAFVTHGYLLVRLTDDEDGDSLRSMWNTVYEFFDYVDTSPDFSVRAMGDIVVDNNDVDDAAVSFPAAAKVGYVNYGDMEFLETRPWNSTTVLPTELAGVVDIDPVLEAFYTVGTLCRRVVQIVVAASTSVIYEDDDDKIAWERAGWAADELVGLDAARSPHRWCRYTTNSTFGAHTDTTFITAVPVSATPGLEVYNGSDWCRPEATSCILTEGEDGHDRYLVLVPGELLQIMSRDEVEASIHRVIPGDRLSAPMLFRGSSAVMDCARYMGGTKGWDRLLQSIDGLRLDEIHQALQEKVD